MSEGSLTRRRVLATGSALVAAALAGCADGNGGSTNGDGSPAGTDAATPTEGAETSATADGATTQTGTEDGMSTDGTDAGTTAGSTKPRTVRFQSTQGTEVVGTLAGSGDCAVVFVPQINLDRGSWERQVEMVREMGHLALAIDEDPENRAQSVVGAVEYLRKEHGVETVVLVGASTGGEAVVAGSVLAPADTVGGVVALSAAGGGDFAERMQGEKVFVVSEGDEQRFVDTARRLHERASKPKRLVVLDGSAHGQRLFESAHAERVTTIVRETVRSACGN